MDLRNQNEQIIEIIKALNNLYLDNFKMLEGFCAKQVTLAIIKTRKNEYFASTNWCYFPQLKCPREVKHLKSGEGYQWCVAVCGQIGHAEVRVCWKAGTKKAKGAELYLIGHTYCCDDCKAVMKLYKIKKVFIGKLPKAIKQILSFKGVENDFTI